jgi:hypothetical protein
MATARVLTSSYQYESRSLLLTSILLPSETKVDTPTPLPGAESRIAIPTAPDGEPTARWPGAAHRISSNRAVR